MVNTVFYHLYAVRNSKVLPKFSCCADYLVRPKYVLDQKDDANLEEFAESPMLTEDNWYPINVLRNSARLFVPKHRLMTLSDAQFMFSFNFDESVSQNVESGLIDLRRDLLVYRIFEGYPDEELGYPLSKQELRGSIDAQQTRLFHEEAAPESHWIPDMKTWLGTTTLNGTVKYRYSDAAWEPQFVAQNTIPFHDEAFPYLIRDNANQRWELCRAGYRFKVLNGAFAIHPGFKSKEDAQSDQDDRTVVLARYAKAVHNFNNWMDLRYPKTTNKCPRMKADDKSRRAYEDRQMLELYSSAERKLRVEQMRHEKEEEQKRAEDDRKWQINVEILRAIKMQENPGKLPEPLANEEANNYE
ncbi:unnamed protein product, partial [Mesorhabditis belari]|uniref:Uncharacterized protein n=1 Tax=Mesorhabditis belari TaxID=2138241 RepID=A0AAF3FSA0_9BILA